MGCCRKKSGCSTKNIESYKIKEILRKLLPTAQKMAHCSGQSLEEIYQNVFSNSLKQALMEEIHSPQKKSSETLQNFEEDFSKALQVILNSRS